MTTGRRGDKRRGRCMLTCMQFRNCGGKTLGAWNFIVLDTNKAAKLLLHHADIDKYASQLVHHKCWHVLGM